MRGIFLINVAISFFCLSTKASKATKEAARKMYVEAEIRGYEFHSSNVSLREEDMQIIAKARKNSSVESHIDTLSNPKKFSNEEEQASLSINPMR